MGLAALVLATAPGCGDDANDQKVAEGTGGSGFSSSGGAVVGGGGAFVGSGGAFVGSGGAFIGSGGAFIGSGGAFVGSGGVVIGSGGVVIGSGGVVIGSGGVVIGSGGVVIGSGGVVIGSGGTLLVGGGAGDAAGGQDVGVGGVTAENGGATTELGGAGGESNGGTASGGEATAGSPGTAGSSGGEGGGPTDTRSPGCGTPLERPDPRVQQTMQIGDATRYYLLDVPSNTDNQTPLSLIFALHGYDMNNVAVVGPFNFTSRSNGQAITVYPYGEGPPPGDVSHWGDHVLEATWAANEANYTYIQTLMADLQDRYCIDTSRVFITGFSMGGFFTNTMACAHNDWFRGFAPVSGGGPGSCADPDTKAAIMIHHGTADDIVEFSSGEDSRDFWIGQNGCNQTSASSYDNCETFDGCPDGKPVVFCIGGWKHSIEGVETQNIWSFFNSLP